MPWYICPKCERAAELPKGNYYCKYCGPSVRMLEVSADRKLELIYKAKELAREIFKDNLVRLEVKGSIVSRVKPFRLGSDIDVEVWLKDARLGSRTVARIEAEEPEKLFVDGHKVHFLIYPIEIEKEYSSVASKSSQLSSVERDILDYLAKAYEKYPEPLLTVHSPYGYNVHRLGIGKRRLSDELVMKYFDHLESLGYIKRVQPHLPVYKIVKFQASNSIGANEEVFERLYEAYEKVVHGNILLAAPVHELRKELGVTNEELSKMLTKIMVEFGPPYIELIQPSIKLPKWTPVEVLGRKYWWVKLRKI